MGKLIERDAAVEVLNQLAREHFSLSDGFQFYIDALKDVELNVMALPTVDAVPVRCKDCLHNRACEIQYHAQAGDLFFCGAAERKDGGNG